MFQKRTANPASPRPEASPPPPPDPVESAISRIGRSEPESIEAAVVRGALEIPGVVAGMLFEVGPDGNPTPVAAAGHDPPEEEAARAAADLGAPPPGSPLLAVSLPRWGSGPAYRLALTVKPGPTPAVTVDRIERFARLAAPFLAAGAGERRGEEARRRLEAVARELATARRSAKGAVAEVLLGRIAARIFAELADPLGSVLGCARTLSETPDESTRATLIDDLLEASSRGNRIVEHLASLCALESRGEWGPFPPRATLLEGAEEGARQFRSGGGRVEIEVGPDLPEIEGSRELLRLSISNALRAIAGRPSAGSSLALEASASPEGLLVRARGTDGADTGADPDESERLGAWIAEEIWKEFRAKVEREASAGTRRFSVCFPRARPGAGTSGDPR